MKKLLIFGLVFLLFISLTTASIGGIGYVAESECVNLPQTTSEYENCNITKLIGPDSKIFTIDEEMDKSGNFFNYTFCNTSQKGQYEVNGICYTDNETFDFNYKFNVNNIGKELTNNEPVIYVLIFVLIILGIFFMYSKNIINEESMVLPTRFFLGGIFTLILWSLFGIIHVISENTNYFWIIDSTYTIFSYVAMIFLMVAGIIALWSFIPWFVKIIRELMRKW